MITLDTYGATGLRASFPYNPILVAAVKKCLGFMWNPETKTWVAEGPEVVLDLQRQGMAYCVTDGARARLDEFFRELAQIQELKRRPLDEHSFEYQEIGAQALALQHRGILGDDPGLGKTKQSLDSCRLAKARRVLVVCLNTNVPNWRDELQMWYPGCPLVLYGQKIATRGKRKGKLTDMTVAERKAQVADYHHGVVITNYEKLMAEGWLYDVDWDVVIFDEAQKVKNRWSQQHQALKNLTSKARYVWALTGSPLEIRLEELFGIMALVRPALFGGMTRFREEHLLTDEAGNIIGTKNHELLMERLGPWFTRRTKAQVLKQLPPKLGGITGEAPQVRYVKLSPEEQLDYDKLCEDNDEWLAEHDVAGGFNTMRLQQYTSSPNLLYDAGARGAKYAELLDIINDWPGRVVVFSFFEQMIARLHAWMDLPARAYITGKVTSAEERHERILDFNRGELGKVFLSNDAGAYGENIVGADLVIHYDLLWNPQKMKQREDRLHRPGQVNPVNVITLAAEGTVDVGMYHTVRQRNQLFIDLVDGTEDHYIKSMTQAQFRRALKGEDPWAA